MYNKEKDKFTEIFIKQYQILHHISINLECDLYTCFDGEEEYKKIEHKLINIKKIKNQLIKTYSTFISEI